MANCIPLLQNYVNGVEEAYCQVSIIGLIMYIIILFFYIWLIKDIIEAYQKPLKHFGEERVRKIMHRLVLLTVLLGATLFFSRLLSVFVRISSPDVVFYKTMPYSLIIFMALYIYIYYIGTKKYVTDKGIFKRE